jgi:hypothetical protein
MAALVFETNSSAVLGTVCEPKSLCLCAHSAVRGSGPEQHKVQKEVLLGE